MRASAQRDVKSFERFRIADAVRNIGNVTFVAFAVLLPRAFLATDLYAFIE